MKLAISEAMVTTILALCLSACGGSSTTTAAYNAKTPVPGMKNYSIDLSVPAAKESATDAEVFDESVLFSPNFSINQNDESLSDLFDPNGGDSNLCFPTALAEDLVYLFAYHQPKFASLGLAGLSNAGQVLDPNALIRQLASLCHTSRSDGTEPLNEIQCVSDILTQSGYGLGKTQMINPYESNFSVPVVQRMVTIDDIRSALKTGVPVLLGVDWYQYDADKKSWTREGGHALGAYGYDYDTSWGDQQIHLKIVNPSYDYGSNRNSKWDTIILEKLSPQAGITYPSGSNYVISGSGFSGFSDRGFLSRIIVVSPEFKN